METSKRFFLLFNPIVMDPKENLYFPLCRIIQNMFSTGYGLKIQDSGRKRVFMELLTDHAWTSRSSNLNAIIYQAIVNLKEGSHSHANNKWTLYERNVGKLHIGSISKSKPFLFLCFQCRQSAANARQDYFLVLPSNPLCQMS